MKNSGIGGQALMEGVMMRNGTEYACAVRKTDGEIVLQKETYKTIGGSDSWRKIPFLRGPFIFLDSIRLGFETLSWSSSFFMEEEESEKKEEKTEKAGKSEKAEKLTMGLSTVLALLLAVGLFIVLPSALVRLLKNVIDSRLGIALAEGVIRLAIFLLYLYLISMMKEIRRVFMYHGAEHKCINCIEHGLPLTVENVRESTRFHKRCGTSFILFTLLVSIIVGIFLPKEPLLLRIGCKLLALPVVMSLSYEFIRLAGSTENPVIQALSSPGLWLQRLTTREPEDRMIEVGIASVEAVFDWKDWEEKNF